jgi:hypothetical protein
VTEPRSSAAVAARSLPGTAQAVTPVGASTLLARAEDVSRLGLLVVAGACRPINPNEDARIEAEIKARLVAEKFANLTQLGS